jgi:PKD domain
MRRPFLKPLAFALVCAVSLVAASGAQAIVINDQGTTAGVALVPGSSLPVGVTAVASPGPCNDPALSLDLSFGGELHMLPPGGLCYQGGPVMHANETITEVWDPRPHLDYASPYVEQFLRDVADASGSLNSPYALTTQYTDGRGRAQNTSLYGGGYDTSAPYPGNGCSPSGIWHYYETGNGFYVDEKPYRTNDVCLTDAQLQLQVQTMVAQEGLVGHTQPGYTPLLVVLTPPGVVVCLDSAGTMCSANSGHPTGQFCSYHSQVVVSGQTFAYVVQPFTSQTGCDEPDAPKFPDGVIDPATLMTDTGARLVSPLSRAEIAAIVNPSFNGWLALDGREMNDNGTDGGCIPQDKGLDSVTIGASKQNPYLIQREFNNGGLIVNDPWALACAPWVNISPSFIVPSAANPGDVVKFDGSKSPTTLLIPQANFIWDFGDGTGGVGPSVFHTYAKGGTYAVKLTVIDRGGNVRSLGQAITVLGPTQVTDGLHANVQLMPQGLMAVLHSGVAVKVTSSAAADGIATLSIPRSAAKKAHLKVGRGSSVVIGRGVVSGIKQGTTSLHLHLSKAVAAKLAGLRHVVLTVRLSLVAAGGRHFAIDVAGHY